METGVPEQIAAALPPSSIDAERSVLGAMLQDSGAATLAFETLAPEGAISAVTRPSSSSQEKSCSTALPPKALHSL